MASAVSVPTHRDANGYDVNSFGCLVKNLPDENEPSLFYDIPREEPNFTTRTYKGNFWSRMTGRDDNSRLSCGAGPGTYDLQKPENPGKLLAEKLRESRRKTCKQKRYIEAVFTKNLREGHPAPNAYAIPKSPFDTQEISCECQEYIFKPPPFGQGAKRFVNVTDENPAPGSYNPMKRKCCPGSIISAPFGSLASRFKSADGTLSPGPGEYFSPNDGLAYEACKKCRRNYVKVGFNSSVSRTSALVGSDGPGPDKYPTDMDRKVPRKSVHHSVFKSTTKRFKCIQKESVAPNAYDVATAYNACHKPCEFLKCPDDAPFNSKQIRMPDVPNWMDINVPGPGLTNMRGDISKNVKGGSIAHGRRFRKAVTETGPGPQDYCLHPYSASSILQRHFNVTLGKPKVLKDLQPPEIPWVRRLRTKKILRSFSKAVAEKNHAFCNSHRH
ncbi:sperm-tail PG-rich repeat-containing protein 2-like [Neodiprion lecontei]|uniref:Sperm-tail PG-rich repeat-containing protein 2-like n=1 Tax=Neodiprion lecontei TaxID=441921 RepID=A0ABM3FR22_NEOLC|nr:sperm-tail PG-rich repeat-containing protein 2-like [Neodiprion lecontei]